MTGTRWRLPHAPLRASVGRAVAFGLVAATALALLAGWWAGTGAVYPLTAVGLFAAIAAILVGAIDAHHPFPRFGPANQVTLTRAVLAALLAGAVVAPPTTHVGWWVVGGMALVAALDGVDGWLARRSRMTSAFGARFDLEIDALVILVLSILVWQHEKAGAWVVLCGLLRYAFVAAGWAAPWLARPMRSTRRGKAVAVGQVVGLSVALAPVVPVPLSTAAAFVTLAALVWSFAVDIRWLWRQDATDRFLDVHSTRYGRT